MALPLLVCLMDVAGGQNSCLHLSSCVTSNEHPFDSLESTRFFFVPSFIAFASFSICFSYKVFFLVRIEQPNMIIITVDARVHHILLLLRVQMNELEKG